MTHEPLSKKHYMGNNSYWAAETEANKTLRVKRRLATIAEQKELEERMRRLGQLSAQERIAYDRARLAHYNSIKRGVK